MNYNKILYQTKIDVKWGEGEYILVGKYKTASTPTKVKHACGHIFTCHPKSLLGGGSKCKCIRYGGIASNSDKFKQRYQAKLDDKFGKNEIRILGEYKGAEFKHKFKHSCGKTFYGKPETVLRDECKCKCLHKPNRFLGLEKHRKEVKQWRGKDYDCLTYYGGHDKRNQYIHKICGHTWTTSRTSFKLSKGCPNCDGAFGSKNRILTKTEIKQRIQKHHGNEYRLLEDHKHIRDWVSIKHKPCGLIYKATMDAFLNGNSKCSACYPLIRGATIIEVTKGKHTFRCQGFEPLSLKKLLKKYKPNDIVTGCDYKNRLMVRYQWNKQNVRYYPDFYIKKDNLIVETKSWHTLGLNDTQMHGFFGQDVFEKTQAKARACIRQGYTFRLHLFKEGKKIKVPKDWYHLTKAQLIAKLGI